MNKEQELLERWDEYRARGEDITPEALCHDCPELLPVMKKNIAAIKEIDEKFPAAESTIGDGTVDYLPSESTADPASPVIPGYEILGELGRGGMGVVYKARQLQLNRIVALKLILAGAHAGADNVKRFLSEAEAVAALSHPNIVQVYEVGHQVGLPYMALEFISGGNVASRLKGKPLSAREAAHLVEQMARGMNTAHQAGIVHRDLKPANVLITEDGQPKITDFGLAKKVEGSGGLTQTGNIMGTPSYMAPEQASGEAKRVGPAADVYALGAVLYACLTGKPPFQSDTPMKTILDVISKEPVSLSQFAPKTPRDLETICLKCLQKEPTQRYSSAEALAEDLRRFQTDEPITARPVGRSERLLKWTKRRPAVAALIAITTIAILTLLIAGLAFNARLQNEVGRANRGEQDAIDKGRKLKQKLDENRVLTTQLVRKSDDLKKSNDALGKTSEELRLKLKVIQSALAVNQLNRASEVIQTDPTRVTRLLHDYDRIPINQRGPAWHLLNNLAQGKNGKKIQGYRFLALSPDGKSVAAIAPNRSLVLLDSTTGRVKLSLKDKLTSVRVAAYSADGKYLATSSNRGTIRIAEINTGDIKVLEGNTVYAKSLAFSPDGRLLASANNDLNRTITLWDVAKGEPRHTFRGYGVFEASRHVAFSPDGKTLAFGHRTGVIKVFDVTTGLEQNAIRSIGAVNSLVFSSDGKTLVVAVGNSVVLLDMLKGRRTAILSGHRRTVRSLSYATERNILASADEAGTIKLWGLSAGQELESYVGDPVFPRVALDDSGEVLALGGGADITVWDLSNERITSIAPGLDRATCVTFGNSSFISAIGGVNASGENLVVWDLNKRQPLFKCNGGSGAVASLAMSSDGKSLFSSGNDGKITLWDVTSGRAKAKFDGGPALTSIACSADGKLLIAASYRDMKIWRLAAKQEELTIHREKYNIGHIAISRNGHLFATNSNGLKVWETNTRRMKYVLPIQYGVKCLAFSPDGGTLAVGRSVDQSGTRQKAGELSLWDMKTGVEKVRATSPIGAFVSVHFSPDNKTLATVNSDRTLKLWDVLTGQEIVSFSGAKDPVYETDKMTVAFSNDGKKLALAGGGKVVKMWNLAPGPKNAIFEHDGGSVMTAAFLEDGRTLATAGSTIRLFDVFTGKKQKPPTPFLAVCRAATFSGDARYVAIGESPERNGRITVRDVKSGKKLALFEGCKHFLALRLNANGSLLAMSDYIVQRKIYTSTLKLWNVENSKLLVNRTITGGGFQSLAFNPRGNTLAVLITKYDPTVREIKPSVLKLFDLSRGKFTRTLAIDIKETGQFAFSPDGRLLAVCPPSFNGNPKKRIKGRIKLWDVNTEKQTLTLGSTDRIYGSVAFRPDGKMLGAATGNGTVELWDLTTGRLRSILESGPVRHLVLSRDGNLLTAVGEKTSIFDLLRVLKQTNQGNEKGRSLGHGNRTKKGLYP